MDPSSINGIERNAASRFIDHTLATPWEQLALDIERALKKSLNHGNHNFSDLEISYHGKSYVLSYYERAPCDKPMVIESRFGVDKYFQLRKSSTEWLDDTPSKRRTIFSAAITALHSATATLKHSIPPLFILSSVDAEESDEILGYSIISPDSSTSCIVNYESLTLLRVHDHHEMRYLDGLYRLFLKKLSAHEDEFAFNSSFCFVKICEDFKCTDFDKLAVFRPTALHAEGGREYQSLSRRYISRDRFDNKMQYSMSRSHEELLEMLWAPFHQRPSPKASPDLLAELHCGLRYPFMKRSAVVDSEMNTSLVPSRQQPDCWSIGISFTMSATALLDSNAAASNHFFPLSRSARRLLAFFIYSMSCPKGISIVNLTSDANGSELARSQLLVEDRASSLSAVLSKQTRSVVKDLCSGGRATRKFRDIIDNRLEMLWEKLFLPVPKDVVDCSLDCTCADGQAAITTRKEPEVVGSQLGSKSSVDADIHRHHHQRFPSTDDELELESVWLAKCAMYASSLDGGASAIADFWCACLCAFRSHWETGQPIPYVRSSLNRREEGGEAMSESMNGLPLWQRHLWDDVQARKAAEGAPFDIPDFATGLAVQKLQMLQMSISVKNESTAVLSPPPSALCVQGSSKDVVVGNNFTEAVWLQRRVPLTEDVLAQQEFIARNLEGRSRGFDSSDDVTEGCEAAGDDESTAKKKQNLLQWSVKQSALVSDMKAWKASFPSGSYEDFCSWYLPQSTGAGVVVDDGAGDRQESGGEAGLKGWTELFANCPAVPVSEQKPLYCAEAEAEKALDYFNSLSPTEVAAELLVAGMSSSYLMIRHNLAYWLQNDIEDGIVTSTRADTIKTIASALERELDTLRRLLDEMIVEVRHDTSVASSVVAHGEKRSTSGRRGENCLLEKEKGVTGSGRQALILADQVANMIERLEEMCERAMEIDDLLFVQSGISCSAACRRCIVVVLSKLGVLTAETEEEKRVIFEMTKLVSRYAKKENGSERNWDSAEAEAVEIGGRELGVPSERTIDIRYSQTGDSNGIQLSEKVYPPPHRLFASVAGNVLRVSFTLCDEENY